MGKKVDKTGLRFGKLVVLEPAGKTKDNMQQVWKCQCDCGNICLVCSQKLSYTTRGINSCGCSKKDAGEKRIEDLTGQKFGMLTVLELTSERRHHSVVWRCVCECGNITDVNAYELKTGHVQSCGCLHSKGEALIEKFLQENNITYAKEFSFKDLYIRSNCKLRFDFAIFNGTTLAGLIEFQGEQHLPSFEKKEFGKQQREITDVMKKEYCEKHGIPLFEIWFNENVNEKLTKILYGNLVGTGSEEPEPVSTIAESGE